MKIYHSYLSFFFLLGLLACNKSDSFNHNKSFSPLNNDSLTLKTSLEKTYQFLQNNEFDSAKILGFELSETSNSFYAGKGNSILGYLYLAEQKDDSAYFFYNQAKGHFENTMDSLNMGKVLGNMAIIQSNQGDYSGSETVAIKALEWIKNQKNADFQASIYNSLAISSDALDNQKEAAYWYKKAIQSESGDYSRAIYRNNLAVSYMYLKEYNLAQNYLNELESDPLVLENPDLHAKVMDNLAFSNWKKNPEKKVEKELNEALNIRIKNNDKWGQIASHAHLSDYFSSKDQAISLLHAEKMYKIASELKSPDDQLEALEKLIDLEIPENIKKYALKYASLNDSLLRERNLSKDHFAKIRYDSERNREENEALRMETAEQELEIERRKVFGILSVSGIVLLFMGFITYQRNQNYKNQQKINDEIHATEMKISGKVHDDIANNLYGVISNLEQNKTTLSENFSSELLEKLDEIYQLSRNISRENSPIETGENYPEELLNLFSNYKTQAINVVLIGFTKEPWIHVNSVVKLQFYKAVQELLINMKKHSKASLVVLKFEFSENKLDFFYTDNGIGIAENQLIKKNGIRITENRIEKIKGRISFAGKSQKGLKVTISIPL